MLLLVGVVCGVLCVVGRWLRVVGCMMCIFMCDLCRCWLCFVCRSWCVVRCSCVCNGDGFLV